MNRKIFVLLPLIASLAACGGGNDSATTPLSSEGTVSVLITDNLTLDYAEVWINVRSISASDANNQSVILYQDDTGQAHNLSQLVNVGALVDANAVPAGSYTSFNIVLANDITLVDQNGATTNATFDQSGNPTFSMTVNGALNVDANQAATLALDFDLQQFTYAASSNTVTPVVVQKDPNSLNQTITTRYGEVEAVLSSSQFVLDPDGSGRNLTVTLHSTASVTNAATGEVRQDTSGLSKDMRISVSGTYDPASLSITASRVQIGSSAALMRHEMEGLITSLNGASLTLDIKEANFMPGANSMSVDVSNAAFSHGALANLAAGQKVEIKGSWDGTSFTAAVVEIEGYSGNHDSEPHNYVDDYAEIKGQISAINGSALTVRVREREHVNGVNVGDDITIDSGNSWIEHGSSACLVAGAIIEAKGPMTGTSAMNANKIEIESGCASSSGSNSDADETGEDDDRLDDDHEDDDNDND